MKLITTLSIVLIFIILSASRCKKDQVNPIDQLPPETQTGANTFGCLVDGKVFLPKGDPFGGPIKKAQYQLVNGRQGFSVSASRSESESIQSVGIIGDSVEIYVGVFDLIKKSPGNLVGVYHTSNINLDFHDYYTTEMLRGVLTIKRFDIINQIISGTFWFDAKDSITGKVVQVREGRFDMPYVR